MSVDTPEDLHGLRAAGQVVAQTIRAMRRGVRPGITTGELDAIARREFDRVGARSGPQLDYGFPGTTCISVNDEAVHGIGLPGSLGPVQPEEQGVRRSMQGSPRHRAGSRRVIGEHE